MRTLALLLALLTVPLAVDAQDTPVRDGVIEAAEVSGLALDRLSPGLQKEIVGLTGQPLDRERLNAIAARIEGEHPDVVAAVRDVARPDGRVHIVFLVARISDDQGLAENINARYLVQHVEVTGIPDTKVSQELLDELQGLVGQPLDSLEADRLVRKLEDELPDYDVRRRVRRGDESGRIRVVFEVARSERSRWLRFTPSRSKLVYHEDQGWSGVLDIPFGERRSNQLNLGFAFGNDDDLVEEYSGYRFRFENRKAGSERLGVGFELSRFSQDWRDVTLTTLSTTPDGPRPYDRRVTFEPKVTFAITPRLRVSGGLSTSELTPLTEGLDSEHVNAFVASAAFEQTWSSRRPRRGWAPRRPCGEAHDGEQNLCARYEFRTGTEGLDSDLIYRRHLGEAWFRTDLGKSGFVATFRAGRITGNAPLFERFTLGDSTTLRGWNKFELAPAGADRMWHQSVEFEHGWVSVFVDAGSVWSAEQERKIRLSSGFSLGALSFGFPLNADDGDAAFILNVRFGVGF